MRLTLLLATYEPRMLLRAVRLVLQVKPWERRMFRRMLSALFCMRRGLVPRPIRRMLKLQQRENARGNLSAFLTICGHGSNHG